MYLPTVVWRRSGWFCRAINFLCPDVMSQRISRSLITARALCTQTNSDISRLFSHFNPDLYCHALKPAEIITCSSVDETELRARTALQLCWKDNAKNWAVFRGITQSSSLTSPSWANTSSSNVSLLKSKWEHAENTLHVLMRLYSVCYLG